MGLGSRSWPWNSPLRPSKVALRVKSPVSSSTLVTSVLIVPDALPTGPSEMPFICTSLSELLAMASHFSPTFGVYCKRTLPPVSA